MKDVTFSFDEVDVSLNWWEFLITFAAGAIGCALPFILKAILISLGL